MIQKTFVALMLAFVSISAKAGFLTPVYQKMAADNKKVEYAKNHSPIKTINYNGTYNYCSATGNCVPYSGTATLSFYSNDVIKLSVNNEYYIKSSVEGNATIYRLPFGHNDYDKRAIFVLEGGEFNFVAGSMVFNYSCNGVNHVDSYTNYGNNTNSSSSSNGYSSSSNGIRCTSCNGTGNCTMCNGEGHYWIQTGMYIGKDIKEYTDCPGCRATGNCLECHGQGVIR